MMRRWWKRMRKWFDGAQPEKPNPNAFEHFFHLGVQYYVIARFAATARLIPVSGNQYHHAVEMLLKGYLAKTISLDELKRKYSHGLNRAWKAFKKSFPSEDLTVFDSLIRELDRFERIRYPDNVLKEGLSAMIQWSQPRTPHKVTGCLARPPHYELSVTDIDVLVGTLFRLCSVNATFFMGGMNLAAVKILENDNPACTGWFPEREQGQQDGRP